jgi:hypothetical protein
MLYFSSSPMACRILIQMLLWCWLLEWAAHLIC